MPTALESKAALNRLMDAAVADATLFASQLDGPAELRRAVMLEVVPDLVAYYSDGSSALAADFYEDAREQAAAAGSFVAIPVVPDRVVKIRRGVAWSAGPFFDGSGSVNERLAAVVSQEVARPYRVTILENRARDGQAVGWRRITRAGGCSFCRMLADRGAVYREKTVRFAAHDHCSCTAEPVFLGGESGPEASVMQYMASARRRTPAEKERLRDYLDTFYPSA